MKKTLIAFLATGSLALTGMGTVQAATNTTNPVPTNKIIHRLPHADSELATFLGMSATDLETAIKSGKTIDQIAQEKNISEDQLKQFFTSQHEKHLAEIKTKLAEKVQSGKITQAQMDERIKMMTEHTGKRFEKPFGKPMMKHSDELTSFLKMTSEEFKTELKNGKTIEQIAASKGITKEQLTQFFTAQHENMVNKMKEELSKKVQTGTMTQDEMNKIVEKISNTPKGPSTIPFKGGFKKGIRHEVKSSTENVIDQVK
jgi:acetyl-CoA acetyltransferase